MTNEKSKRRIESVLDMQTGKEVFANEFFTQEDRIIFQQRGLLELAIQNKTPKFVCYYCKQYVKISGGKGNYKNRNAPVLHFAHLKDSEDCHIKTDTKLTREEIRCIKYNGAKESDLHDYLKSFIHERLQENESSNKGISNPEKEKRYKNLAISKQWKQPDIQSIYFDKNLVFEIQLSTTFLDVIVSRQEFYKERKTYIVWVFHYFNPENDTLRFMEKDIIYTNNLNAFVLDSEAIKKSTEQNDLVLKCYHAVPVKEVEKDEIGFEWKSEFVTLDQLTYRERDFKVFFYDSEGEYEKMELNFKKELDEKKEKEEKRLRELRRIEQQEIDDELESAYALQRERREKDYNDNSPLQNYFKYPSDRIRQKVAKLFLEHNFEIHRWDEKFIANLYAQHINENDNEYIDSIVYTIYFIKAERHELMSKIIRVQQPLNIFLSLKLNKIFGYRFSKMIQIVHVAFDQHKKFGDLFLTALEKYNQMNSIIEDDRNGKLKIKLDIYHKNPPQQNHDYDDLFKTIFPELFEK